MVGAMIPRLEGAEVRRRGRCILGPLDLELAEEGATILLGPNGSGKTTLLKVLHGVERLSGGARHWPVPEEKARPQQAYVFQSPTILRRTVAQNLAYPLQLLRRPRGEIAAEVATWAERIGLTPALDRYAPNLSGGEKQKLALARALIRQPKVLFLDEPSANLDGRATREIEALLGEVLRAGTRIVMATHDLGQARRLAGDVLFLLGGKVHERGSAEAFFAGPQTPQARAFLAGDIVE
jgi:tungstate transport system ATP-binding protein